MKSTVFVSKMVSELSEITSYNTNQFYLEQAEYNDNKPL
jgi:hypothetical protein